LTLSSTSTSSTASAPGITSAVGSGFTASAAEFTPESPLTRHGSPVDPEHVPAVKERRKLLKKLRQISGLKQKMSEGCMLDAQQRHKLDTEHLLRDALREKEAALVAAGVTLSPGSATTEDYGHAMPTISI
jgi:hypothetical protein